MRWNSSYKSRKQRSVSGFQVSILQEFTNNRESTRGAGGFEVSLEGMMRISFNRDPEEAAAGPLVFSRKLWPAASGGERVANQHAAQRARRRKLPMKVFGKIRAEQRQLPLGRG